ncbi:diaminopropionate ammonia-lyase [Arthrobacter castelli]|uniref:diaminopropionate ammonia-lyase n=1 Tax=Arthrobacter castelli TaxID=271431 RepID=UPI000569CF1C|nr:diaminopropionate ammonia-lyase [Arthrobacter castelli]
MTDYSSGRTGYINSAARGATTTPAPADVLRFHRRMPGYAPTRLHESAELAGTLGVGRVFIKEEAVRFGLPAFKMVGASWAIHRALAERTEDPDFDWTFDDLAERFGGTGGMTLVCATDGNHGRAVAHGARMLGLGARVFVPAQIGRRAKEGIRSENADLVEVDAPYDDVVMEATAAADADPAAMMVQDTAWEGYEQIPAWIVEGYSTIFRELDAQLADAGLEGPDVMVTPCGVGSLIQATAAHYRGSDRSADSLKPSLLSVEPDGAPCLLESLKAGRPVAVATGHTRMAGLNCGNVSTIAWPILRDGIDAAVTITDDEDLAAVKELERLQIDAGPCGAASLAGLQRAFADPAMREGMAVTGQSVVVLLSTESREANPVED